MNTVKKSQMSLLTPMELLKDNVTFIKNLTAINRIKCNQGTCKSKFTNASVIFSHIDHTFNLTARN